MSCKAQWTMKGLSTSKFGIGMLPNINLLTCVVAFVLANQSNGNEFISPTMHKTIELGRVCGLCSTGKVFPATPPGVKIVEMTVRSLVELAMSRQASR